MSDSADLKRILIFDDDSDFRKLLLLRLKKMFAEVELVEYDPIASGVPGDDFNWGQFDVLLLDYYLCIHGVTGLDILRKNRKNPQFPATIMLTGAGSEEIAVRALKSGVSDYIRKETLNKEELREAILSAHEEHKNVRQRVSEATLHGQAFNKSLFYQQLEQPLPEANKRVLLLVQLDGHEQLLAAVGVIVRDNAIRHIAKQAFEVFQIGECNPSITRFSEYSIALLIDDPGSEKTLSFNLEGLCTHLRKRPYKFDGKKFRFTVSIGVVPLSTEANSIEEVMNKANKAIAIASNTRDASSFSILSEETPKATESDTSPAQSSVASVEEIAEAAAKPPVEKKPEAAAKPPVEKKPEAAAKPPVEKTTTASAKDSSKAKKTAGPKENVEAILDDAALNVGALQLKRQFEEKRVVQTFQPVISLVADEEEEAIDAYTISLNLIDSDGATLTVDDIYAKVSDIPSFFQYIDRWQLKESLGRIVNTPNNNYLFLMSLSDASLADATLFNWLRELLSGLETSNPGHAIALEISSDDFAARQKPAEALITYLRKSHGFKFVLAHSSDLETLKTLIHKTTFDLLRVSPEMIQQIAGETVGEGEEATTLLSNLKSRGTSIIVQDVEDATTFTEVISVGADYAIGDFIGEASTQLDDMTNVESFEIS